MTRAVRPDQVEDSGVGAAAGLSVVEPAPTPEERGEAPAPEAREVPAWWQLPRARLLATSLLGLTLLGLAQVLQAGPPWQVWVGRGCGMAGVWLVPGAWLCSLAVRTGGGLLGRLATRVGVLLCWYALAGPVINTIGEGASVTAGGILGLTAASTGAVCVGMALTLLPGAADERRRTLLAGVVGAAAAQLVILLATTFSDGVDDEQIRRLDLLIVLGCGLLAILGAASGPTGVVARAAQVRLLIGVGLPLVVVAAIAAGAAALQPPTQRLPTELTAEQVKPPPGVDAAVLVRRIGTDDRPVGPLSLAAFDILGRAVDAEVRVRGVAGDPRSALALVDLPTTSRSDLCAQAPGKAGAIKFTVRQEQGDAFALQLVLPVEWCAR